VPRKMKAHLDLEAPYGHEEPCELWVAARPSGRALGGGRLAVGGAVRRLWHPLPGVASGHFIAAGVDSAQNLLGGRRSEEGLKNHRTSMEAA